MKEVFNPKYVDDPNVTYSSYAGRTNLKAGTDACAGSVYPNEPKKVDFAQSQFIATAMFLEGWQGVVNDGLVTVQSAKWGTFEQCIPADHLKEVGMFSKNPNVFNHRAFYRQLVDRIRADGF